MHIRVRSPTRNIASLECRFRDNEVVEFTSRFAHTEKMGIRFLGPVQSASWPPGQYWLFDHVQDWAIKIPPIQGKRRYRLHRKAMASTDKAEGSAAHDLGLRCREEMRMEPGWRATIEPEVLRQFIVEVTWWVQVD
jgi:hypothetical protein